MNGWERSHRATDSLEKEETGQVSFERPINALGSFFFMIDELKRLFLRPNEQKNLVQNLIKIEEYASLLSHYSIPIE